MRGIGTLRGKVSPSLKATTVLSKVMDHYTTDTNNNGDK